MAECAVCTRPVPDVAYACQLCATDLATLLRDTAALWPELQTTALGQARMADPGPRARGHVTVGLPFSWTASEVAYAVRNTVTTWARVVVDERGLPHWPSYHEPSLLTWLSQQLGWLRYQPYAAEAFDELGYACRLVAPAVDRPRPRLDAGLCLAPTDTGPCQQRLSTVAGAVIVHCPACRAAHTTQARRETILAAAKDTLGTATELSHWLTILGEPLPTGTIYSWASRGRLLQHGIRQGEPAYRFGDVRDLQVARRGKQERIAA